MKKDVLLAEPSYQLEEKRCGFGRLGLCCLACPAGPCRIDPFGYGASLTGCGLGKEALKAKTLLAKILAGASLSLQERAGLDEETKALTWPADKIKIWEKLKLVSSDLFYELSEAARVGLNPASYGAFELEIQAMRLALAITSYGVPVPEDNEGLREAGLGVLYPSGPCIVIDASNLKLAREMDIAAREEKVKLVAGGKGADYLSWWLGLSLLGGKEELRQAIKMGLVDVVVTEDALLLGRPFKLLGSPVVFLNAQQEREAAKIIASAKNAFNRREPYESPEKRETWRFHSGWREGWGEALQKIISRRKFKGVAFLLACSGEGAEDLARRLKEENYLVLAAGCGISALIKAGLMSDISMEEAAEILNVEHTLLPLWHLGGCQTISNGLNLLAAMSIPITVVLNSLGCNLAYVNLALSIAYGARILAPGKSPFSEKTLKLFDAAWEGLEVAEVDLPCGM